MKEDAVSFIRRNTRFFLTAHETPDADAIGAECATFHALKQLGKEVRIVNADPTPRIFRFIDSSGSVEVLDDSFDNTQLENSCLLILDSNDINNIGGIRDVFLNNVDEYFIIDHHEEDGTLAKANYIRGDASSTCELLFEIFELLDVTITREMAVALYAGIVYDTGSFVYPKTSPRTFRIARILVEAGAKPNDVFTKMYESNTISSLLLQSMVLATLTLHFDDGVAVQKMTKDTLVTSGAPYEEGQTLINVPLKSESIRVSVFLKESEGGILRCSLRSKGDIDVAAIASKYNGGGHKNAAGFKTLLPLEEIETKVLEDLNQYFE
jgi:bifunctional oligoribonuclease and PAP phosphatase NrnA